jgi:CubicO group peptidase (beta-lactamase class C family)/predicted GIY-YIG superfamily endonuclease
LKGNRNVTQWSIYMVRCGDGSLYTGIATDVHRRLAEHRGTEGRGARYLRGRAPLRLVFEREVGSRGLAQRIETRIKKLSKPRKERLLVEDGWIERLLKQAGQVVFVLAFLMPLLGRPAFAEPWRWERTTYAAEGADPTPFDQLKSRIEADRFRQVRGILVARDGKILFEEYFNGSDPELLIDIRSAGKSYTSALIGIAIDRGLIPGVEEKLLTYFPEYQATPDDPKRDITLRHVLMMSFGLAEPDAEAEHPWDWTDRFSQNWIPEVLALPMTFEPGSRWEYHSAAPSLLAPVLRRSTGMSVPEFAARYLFEPLDMTNYQWTFFADGHAVTQGGFWTRPRDMAKIGQLFLQGGRWNDRQIISEAWVEESTRAWLPAYPRIEAGYGYYWWREVFMVGGRRIEGFSAAGNGGNKIHVFPDLDLVVVLTCTAYSTPWYGNQARAMVNAFILPGVLGMGTTWQAAPFVPLWVCLAIFFLGMAGWPVLFLIRRTGRGTGPWSPAAAITGWLTALIAAVAAGALLQAPDFEFMINAGYPWTPDPLVIGFSWALILSAAASAGFVIRNWVWKPGALGDQILLTLVTVAVLYFVAIIRQLEILSLTV